MKIPCCLILTLCCLQSAYAQKANFDVLHDLETLSGIQVNDIKQDNTGFLWIGTTEGLYRYDGYNLKLYETQDRFLGSSTIQVLFIDKNDRLWVGTKGGLLKYEKNTDRVSSFRHDPGNPVSIGDNNINSLEEDRDGNIWIGLSKAGLDLFHVGKEEFYHFRSSQHTGLLSDDISDIHLNDDNNLWVSTLNAGIYKLDLRVSRNHLPSSATFQLYKTPPEVSGNIVVPFLFEDGYAHHLYAAVEDYGFLRYDDSSDSFIPFKIEGIENKSLYDATFFSKTQVWVSTSDGLKIVNPELGTTEACSQPVCRINRPVFVVFTDRQNINWIGTDNGLKKNIATKIKHNRLDDTQNYAPINNVVALCKQGQYLWLGAWGKGLFLKDEESGQITRVNPENDILTEIWDIKLIRDTFLLVATSRGMVRLTVDRPSFKKNFKEYNYPLNHHITSITKNIAGDTWVGAWQSDLYKVDERTGMISEYTGFSTKKYYIMSLHLDSENRLWIGTAHAGLICLTDPEGEATPRFFSQHGSADHKITSDYISAIFEDNKKRLWIGTGDLGINVIDLKTGKVSWMVKGKYNLPANTIRAIIQDDMGQVWISSKSGLSKYDAINNLFINYAEDDGLEYMEFNPKAVENNNGTLYFGNQMGYNTFRPEDLETNSSYPKVFITDFKIFNKSVLPGEQYEGDVVLPAPLSDISDLKLHHKIRNIAFEFSTLNFINPKQEIYAYKLEGADQDWQYTNAFNRIAAYTNLEPGDYVFSVKTVRNNDISKNAATTLHIRIASPLWKQNWFKIVLGTLFILFIYVLHLIRLVRLKRKKIMFEKLAQERVQVIQIKNKQLEKQNEEIQHQADMLHEADQSKLTFFTNISHEFRTPLMLIIGPITSLLRHQVAPRADQNLLMIHRNAQRLLRLMDQIMDISKVEAGRMGLELTEGDIIRYIREIAASFEYLAHTNNIEFEFKSSSPGYCCYFDHDKIEKIIYNLLSNAFKVTPSSGCIAITTTLPDNNLDASPPFLEIKISDSGSGISNDELPYLFTRFYRTGNYAEGTGMGLALTKSLVELHQGIITVESGENNGTRFIIKIPVDKSSYPPECIKNTSLPAPGKSVPLADMDGVINVSSSVERSTDSNAPTILVLDDNEDMRNFMLHLLIPYYHVLMDSDGESGIKLAGKYQPDLIISDMMMPVMDGYQFLRAVKSNPEVSHIPVILLTAKSNVESRLRGLEEGADDYLTKPFDERILLARVKYLMDRRQITKDRFATDISIAPREIAITSLDETFIQRLLDITEVNIANPEFGSDIICRELGVSRSHLYTKIKALTGLSVNEFVRTIRLKRSAVLLTKGQQNVNEVASNVGFNDRSYFSKCFTRHFGVSPAQYQKTAETAG